MSSPPVEWSALLVEAVTKPGVIAEAYRQFWNYSTGNQILAWFQCLARAIAPGPIHTFVGWKQIGRHVRMGEKALILCMPVTVRRKEDDKDAGAAGVSGVGETIIRFVYRANWFVLSQTEGVEYQPAELPAWSEQRALAELNVTRGEFRHLNGNVQGYARGREVAISPIAFMPYRTLLHEIAHVALGHTAEIERLDDEEATPVNLREVEAESVALICCESLNLGGADYSRGYIQHWLRGEMVEERSAQRIFKAADQIIKAGMPKSAEGPPAIQGQAPPDTT